VQLHVVKAMYSFILISCNLYLQSVNVIYYILTLGVDKDFKHQIIHMFKISHEYTQCKQSAYAFNRNCNLK